MTLRILQVGSGMPGWAGTEKYVLEISHGLRKLGHDVVIACRKGSELEGRSKGLQIPVEYLEMRSTHDWRQLPRFLRAIRGNYDIVHIHSYRDYIVPAAAAKMAGVPAIMTRHLPHPFRNRVTALLCGRFFYTRIIAISEYIRSLLLSNHVPEDRLALVRNGIDLDAWVTGGERGIRDELGIPHDALVVAAAGRIAPEKGFDHLIRAVAVAREAGVELFCLIAGAGDLSALKILVSELGLESRVFLLGFRRDIPGIYSAADIVAVPSIWQEPFGFAVVEAFACGRPVVASRVGGMVEIVTPGTGVLVDPGDERAIARAVIDLSWDRKRCVEMGRQARIRARDFPLDGCVRGVESVYRDVVEGLGEPEEGR